MKDTRPDFFIIGAPKCGTTALYEWLGRHPDVYAPHKEPCFYSQDVFSTAHLPTHIGSQAEYERIFATQDHLLSGEATPKYLYSDRALSEIAERHPQGKLIVCLRDPVELAVSYHSQKVKEGVELDLDFERAWMRGMDASGTHPISDAAEIDGLTNYFFWAAVGSRLDVVHRYFSADSIQVLLLEELLRDPRKAYLETLAFLGLPDDGQAEFPRTNERVAIRDIGAHTALLRVRRALRPALDRLPPYMGERLLRVSSFLRRLNTTPGKYSGATNESLREKMYAALRREVELAERFLDGRKLVAKRR